MVSFPPKPLIVSAPVVPFRVFADSVPVMLAMLLSSPFPERRYCLPCEKIYQHGLPLSSQIRYYTTNGLLWLFSVTATQLNLACLWLRSSGGISMVPAVPRRTEGG